MALLWGLLVPAAPGPLGPCWPPLTVSEELMENNGGLDIAPVQALPAASRSTCICCRGLYPGTDLRCRVYEDTPSAQRSVYMLLPELQELYCCLSGRRLLGLLFCLAPCRQLCEVGLPQPTKAQGHRVLCPRMRGESVAGPGWNKRRRGLWL